jgi:hypothetical protein
MTDKEFCSEMLGQAAQFLDQGLTPEDLLTRLELEPAERVIFESAMLYFAMRMVKSTREEPGDN